jgi:hypothetical protein
MSKDSTVVGYLDLDFPQLVHENQLYTSRLTLEVGLKQQFVLRARDDADIPMRILALVPDQQLEVWFPDIDRHRLLGMEVEAEVAPKQDWKPNVNREETEAHRPYEVVRINRVMYQDKPPFKLEEQWAAFGSTITGVRIPASQQSVAVIAREHATSLFKTSKKFTRVMNAHMVLAKGLDFVWSGYEETGKTQALIETVSDLQASNPETTFVVVYIGERMKDLIMMKRALADNTIFFTSPLGASSEQILLAMELGLLYSTHLAGAGKDVFFVCESLTRAEINYSLALKAVSGRTQPGGKIPEAMNLLSKVCSVAGQAVDRPGSLTLMLSMVALESRHESIIREVVSWVTGAVGTREFSTIPRSALYMGVPMPGPFISENLQYKWRNSHSRWQEKVIGPEGFQRLQDLRQLCLELMNNSRTIGHDLIVLEKLAELSLERDLPGIWAIKEISPTWLRTFYDEQILPLVYGDVRGGDDAMSVEEMAALASGDVELPKDGRPTTKAERIAAKEQYDMLATLAGSHRRDHRSPKRKPQRRKN